MSLSFLKKQKESFEKFLKEFIEVRFEEKTELTKACEYSLTNGGKRIRPVMVMMIAEALKKGFNVFPVALSVEFFHTASLIADDLPSMDNEVERRSKPALHLVFGESVALLASYSLIAAAYEMIAENRVFYKQLVTFVRLQQINYVLPL